MPAENFRITGHRDLERRLAKLDRKMQTRLMRNALGKPARAIVKDARALVPTDTVLLKKSLGSRIVVRAQKKQAFAVMGPRKGFEKTKAAQKLQSKHSGAKAKRRATYYAHLVEFGTKPHKQRFIPLAGGVIRLAGDLHPGARPRPFLRPAFDKNKQRATPMIAAELRKGIESAI